MSIRDRQELVEPAQKFALEMWAKRPDIPPAVVRQLWVSVDTTDNTAIPTGKTYRRWYDKLHGIKRGKKNSEITWEQIKDFVLNAIEKAGKVAQLEDDNYTLRNELAAAQNELKITKEVLTKGKSEEIRFKLAKQQGDIGPRDK